MIAELMIITFSAFLMLGLILAWLMTLERNGNGRRER